MKNTLYYKVTLYLTAIFTPFTLFGQQEVQMADTIRSNGKIYVLVAIILLILIGLIVYLITLDRKMMHLEKKISQLDGKNTASNQQNIFL